MFVEGEFVKAGGEFKRLAIILFNVVLDVIKAEGGFETRLLKVALACEEEGVAAEEDDDDDDDDDDDKEALELEVEADVGVELFLLVFVEVELEFVLALFIEELCCLFNTFCK